MADDSHEWLANPPWLEQYKFSVVYLSNATATFVQSTKDGYTSDKTLYHFCFCYCVVTIYDMCVLCIAGPPNPDNLPEDGKLKSEVMVKDTKRYYLDLKENQRGRFLRVSLNQFRVSWE